MDLGRSGAGWLQGALFGSKHLPRRSAITDRTFVGSCFDHSHCFASRERRRLSVTRGPVGRGPIRLHFAHIHSIVSLWRGEPNPLVYAREAQATRTVGTPQSGKKAENQSSTLSSSSKPSSPPPVVAASPPSASSPPCRYGVRVRVRVRARARLGLGLGLGLNSSS